MPPGITGSRPTIPPEMTCMYPNAQPTGTRPGPGIFRRQSSQRTHARLRALAGAEGRLRVSTRFLRTAGLASEHRPPVRRCFRPAPRTPHPAPRARRPSGCITAAGRHDHDQPCPAPRPAAAGPSAASPSGAGLSGAGPARTPRRIRRSSAMRRIGAPRGPPGGPSTLPRVSSAGHD